MTARAAVGPRRRLLAAAAVLTLAGLATVDAVGAASPARAAGDGPEFSATRTLTRDIQGADGTVTTVDSRQVTVTVDRTQDLRGRQVVRVDWSGARPSSAIVGAVSEQAAFTGTEYPVVVLQCRGTDDPDAPAAQRVTPESCWTTSFGPRAVGGSVSSGGGVYRHDLYATDAQRAESIPDATAWADVCDLLSGSEREPAWRIPFVSADGKHTYYGCQGGADVAPEMGVDTALPANERVEATHADGTGWTTVEVRTAAENPSLGCSVDVPCSLVVIPVMGVSCRDADAWCAATGRGAPGSLYDSTVGSDPAVTGQLWAAASNWRNRFTVPLGFAPSSSACDVLDSREPVQLYGSELIRQAAMQWSPRYCADAKRFKLQINTMPEGTAFTNLGRGYGVAALATYPDEDDPDGPALGYAPVAVSGFAVAYVIDAPDGSGPVTQLRLTPRLLAKLMTASYPGMVLAPGSDTAAQRPDLAKNPASLQLDPEFTALNPKLASSEFSWNLPKMFFASLLGPSVPSDVMEQLTEYVAADPEAVAFLKGEPDEHGMTVNTAYKGVSLPRSDWPLLDTWIRPSAQGCETSQPLAWFNRVLAPVSDLGKVAQDMLGATPETLYQYAVDNVTGFCKFTRTPRLFAPGRAMLGLVTLADAKLYGLSTAELRTGSGGTYVAPDDASLAAAIGSAKRDGENGPFLVDQVDLRSHPDAYPGTMVVHAAAPLSGVDASTAAQVAQFVTTATTEGQVPGSGPGQLPPGYLPITPAGPTAALFAAAQATAALLKEQRPPAEDADEEAAVDDDPGVDLTDNPVGLGGDVPVDDGPQQETVTGTAAGPATGDVETAGAVAVTPTQHVGPLAGLVLPIVLGLGLAVALGALVLRSVLVARARR